MSTVKDRTEDFKDAMRTQAVSMGYHESKVASLLASVGIHKPQKRVPFTKASLKVLENIETLEQLLGTHKTDYVDVHRTSEQDRDSSEQEVAASIKTCKEVIDILNSHISEEEVSNEGCLTIKGDSNVDARAHKKGMVLLLSERLDSVSAQFDKLRVKGFQDAMNKPIHRRILSMLFNNKSVYVSTSSNCDQIQPKRTQSDTDTDTVQQQCLDDETLARQLQSHGEWGLEFVDENLLQVPHHKQQSSWDCGLACILMILRTLGIGSCNIEDLKDLCNINSIWTVDLAYLLQKFSIKFSYFTVTLGANPAYSAEKFYVEQFSNDLVRVDMLFHNASKAGVDIQCRSISEHEIASFILTGKYVAVALVDQSKLSDSWLNNFFLPDFLGHETAYTGHYIVICGYNTTTDAFEIRDPASSRRSRMITSKCLKEARKSFGTDEDLLLVSLEGPEDQSHPAV